MEFDIHSCFNNNLEKETAPTLPNIYFICQISTPRLLKLGRRTILNFGKTAHITVKLIKTRRRKTNDHNMAMI